jgi:Uncharacterized ABC-type transport system, periplasmic component/surface lipoprotein
MKKQIIAFLLTTALALSLVSCGTTAKTTDKAKSKEKKDTTATTDTTKTEAGKKLTASQVKVGFIYVGDADDRGYSQAHDDGRKELEKELGVKTMVVENIPETSECATAAKNLIAAGCNVIYATSFGHMQYIAQVAKENPNVYFGHATGYTRDKNLTTYMGRIYQARYLSGIVAGLKTKSNKIGYVAAMPIPEVIRGINAFTLGVKSVNPKATVEVSWLNTWYDGTLEKTSALGLIDKGCDVIAQHCDSTAPQVAAQEKGVFSIGYNRSAADVAPKAYLTAPLFHWGKFYVENVKAVMDGTWKSEDYWKGLESGIVSLDKLSSLCEAGTQEKVDAAQKAILDGSNKIFTGEIKDNQGNVKVKAGQTMTDKELTSFNWFVEGVIGNATGK